MLMFLHERFQVLDDVVGFVHGLTVYDQAWRLNFAADGAQVGGVRAFGDASMLDLNACLVEETIDLNAIGAARLDVEVHVVERGHRKSFLQFKKPKRPGGLMRGPSLRAFHQKLAQLGDLSGLISYIRKLCYSR